MRLTDYRDNAAQSAQDSHLPLQSGDTLPQRRQVHALLPLSRNEQSTTKAIVHSLRISSFPVRQSLRHKAGLRGVAVLQLQNGTVKISAVILRVLRARK